MAGAVLVCGLASVEFSADVSRGYDGGFAFPGPALEEVRARFGKHRSELGRVRRSLRLFKLVGVIAGTAIRSAAAAVLFLQPHLNYHYTHHRFRNRINSIITMDSIKKAMGKPAGSGSTPADPNKEDYGDKGKLSCPRSLVLQTSD